MDARRRLDLRQRWIDPRWRRPPLHRTLSSIHLGRRWGLCFCLDLRQMERSVGHTCPLPSRVPSCLCLSSLPTPQSLTSLFVVDRKEYVGRWPKLNKVSMPPNFTRKDQDGKTVSLSKFNGKTVVLYFYPADETPGCTKQVTFVHCSYVCNKYYQK